MMKLHRQKGQGLVEFGIGILFFIPLLVIVFFACVYAYNIMAVSMMTRDTARQISTCTSATEVDNKIAYLKGYYAESYATKPVLYDWDKKLARNDNVTIASESPDNSTKIYYVNVNMTANRHINLTIGLPDTISMHTSMPMENYKE